MAELKLTMVDIIADDGSPRVALNIECDKSQGQVKDKSEPVTTAEIMAVSVKRLFDSGALSGLVPLISADLVNAVHEHRKKKPKILKATQSDLAEVSRTKKG